VGERRFDVAALTGDITLHGGRQPGLTAAGLTAGECCRPAACCRPAECCRTAGQCCRPAEAAECLALLPAEGAPYPASVRHHPTTDRILSKGACGGAEGRWSLAPSGELKHAGSGLCAAYSTTNWTVAVFPEDCAKAAADPRWPAAPCRPHNPYLSLTMRASL
jgi:hypothetical protein